MRTPVSSLPDLEGLTRLLNVILAGQGADGGRIEVVQRKRPRHMSTFPIEIVTCRLGDGTFRRLFLKYQSGRGPTTHGHRRGVAYETEIYRRILVSRGERPKLHGSYIDETTGEACLALEDLGRGTQVRQMRRRTKGPSQEDAMLLASRWIARFHADLEPAIHEASRFMTCYDEQYYLGWARRTEELTSTMHAENPWLPRLCRRADPLLAPLTACAPTIIHGEFYSNNLILRRRRIHVVDWEAAAVGPGVIDLAAITEGRWSPHIVRRAVAEYRETRWPEGAPADFERTLEAARLYLHFRWLGEQADTTVSPQMAWRLEALHAKAVALDLVDAPAEALPVRGVGVGAGRR